MHGSTHLSFLFMPPERRLDWIFALSSNCRSAIMSLTSLFTRFLLYIPYMVHTQHNMASRHMVATGRSCDPTLRRVKKARCSLTVRRSNRMLCWGQIPKLLRMESISDRMLNPLISAEPKVGVYRPTMAHAHTCMHTHTQHECPLLMWPMHGCVCTCQYGHGGCFPSTIVPQQSCDLSFIHVEIQAIHRWFWSVVSE